MKLYELVGDYERLAQLAESAEPADQQAFLDTMEGLAEEIDAKVINCAVVCRCIEANSKMLKDEESRLAAKRKSLDSSLSNLKKYMQRGMEAAGREKIKGTLFTVSLQQNPPSVVLDVEPEKLPKLFQRLHIEADKSTIAEVLKSGEVVEWAHLDSSGKSLRIR